jgi:hypothetical protein
MTPEGKLQTYLKDRVLKTGGAFRKLSWIGRRGAPDCFIWWPGPVFAFVEVKVKGRGRLSKLQERECQRMRDAGFDVAVVWTKEDIDALLSRLTQPFGCINLETESET